MSTVTIHLADEQHERLKALASARGTSLDKLFEEFSSKALAEFDAQTRFLARGARGDSRRGLDILDELDRLHADGRT